MFYSHNKLLSAFPNSETPPLPPYPIIIALNYYYITLNLNKRDLFTILFFQNFIYFSIYIFTKSRRSLLLMNNVTVT